MSTLVFLLTSVHLFIAGVVALETWLVALWIDRRRVRFLPVFLLTALAGEVVVLLMLFTDHPRDDFFMLYFFSLFAGLAAGVLIFGKPKSRKIV